MIHISPRNKKIDCPSISLPPIITCPWGCTCAGKCYAQRLYKLRPTVRKAWSENLREYQKAPGEYFAQLLRYVKRETPRYFRYHVGGDIPSYLYLGKMIDLAWCHPTTIFLAFTKQYSKLEGLTETLPENLVLIASAWPGMKLPKSIRKRYRVAWVSADPRVPDTYFKCGGKCENCNGRQCWNGTSDIVFDLH